MCNVTQNFIDSVDFLVRLIKIKLENDQAQTQQPTNIPNAFST